MDYSAMKKTELIGELQRLREMETGREQACREIQENQKLHRSILDNIRDGLMIVRNGRIDYVNNRACEILGYPRKELKQLSGLDIAVPEEKERLRKIKEEVDRGEIYLDEIEFWIIRKDGTRCCVQERYATMEDETDSTTQLVIITDVTDRKEIEEALMIKNSAIESSINAIALADLQGNLTYVNPSFVRMWGYDGDYEIIDKPVVKFWRLKEKADVVLQTLRDTGSWVGELTARRKDGSLFHVHLSASMVEDETGRPVCMMGSFVDITERLRAQEAMRESEERFRDLFENINDLVQSVAPDGSILYVNRAWREKLGYSEEEIASVSLFDIIHPDSLEHCKDVFKCLISGKEVRHIEAQFKAKNGTLITVEGSANCRLQEGKPVATRAIFRDITERKETEEAARKLEAEKLVIEEMKELNVMKSQFTESVAHELRTPMTPLKSVVDMFLGGSLGELTSKQREMLVMMERNIERLTRFATEALALSRLESGKYKLESRELPVHDIVRSVAELLEKKARDRNSTISVEIDSGTTAYVDTDALADVLANLIDNAIMHTPEGTAITVSCKNLQESSVEMSVADNGQGIPEAALPHIFERFHQVDKKAGPGYRGIGLAVCKGLVEAMGGKISVESHPGEGIVFRFTLPTTSKR